MQGNGTRKDTFQRQTEVMRNDLTPMGATGELEIKTLSKNSNVKLWMGEKKLIAEAQS